MLPHPETVAVLTELRRHELLAEAERRRLVPPRQPRPGRRPIAASAAWIGLINLAGRPAAWLRRLRQPAPEIGGQIPPPA